MRYSGMSRGFRRRHHPDDRLEQGQRPVDPLRNRRPRQGLGPHGLLVCSDVAAKHGAQTLAIVGTETNRQRRNNLRPDAILRFEHVGGGAVETVGPKPDRRSGH